MNYYRIYGREKGNGRFKAIDLESGTGFALSNVLRNKDISKEL